ncbi:MAG: ABC transporter ATP-binding protein [Sandaracinaceae bacterium]
MIRVERVSHWFGQLHVLNDVSFHVPKGEIFGFIGPNGAGKTTTIRMIATLLEPDRGHVYVDGIDCAEEPAAVRRMLGFMPDSFGVYERVTVREYLEFFAAAHDLPRPSRKKTVDAVMELTELGDLGDRLVRALSKGMKQRLAIARTLLHDPKVLVLDEPANGLDPRARIEMRDLIEELQRLGKTILLSSHILTELSDMCTSVAILEKGRLVAAGSVETIGRELTPVRGVRIRLLTPPEDAAAILGRAPAVIEAERDPDGSFELAVEGGDAEVAALVAYCVQSGLSVVRVEPDRNDLERIFLEVTKGELQ